MNNLERELKLRPMDPDMLDRLAALERFGTFSVVGRRHELQHNSFFDTAAHALGRARLGFRRRTVDGQPRATWTLKADSQVLRGVATRTEIELQLDPGLAPVLALTALRAAAQQRGAVALAEEVGDALADGGLPVAQPFLELETDRTILDLEATGQHRQVELALDRVRLVGHAYAEQEIEAELKHGDEAALDSIRTELEARGPVQNSEGGKLSRALAHLDACACPSGRERAEGGVQAGGDSF
jgi:inorganic triphosphatase YgiF